MGTREQPAPKGEHDERLAEHLRARLAGDLDPRGGERVHHVVSWALPFVARRRPGERKVRVSNRVDDGAARTVIEVLIADQPFLVDTFRLNLRRLGLRERRFLHPILTIERDEDGSVARVGSNEVKGVREAYLYAEVPPIADVARRERIGKELGRVFDDVQHVVVDHGRMVRMIRKHAADIEFAGKVVGIERARATELMDFLSWIADDNYIFFGYRWYDVERIEGRSRIRVDAQSGLGLMRNSESSRFRESLEEDEIPELVRSRLASDRLVFFDKSRTTSIMHRVGRLDCVSVKVVDESGEVAGFGRFIGLLTHKAISMRGSEIPLLRRRCEMMLDDLGMERGSHNCKAAIGIFDSLPPEFLFPFEVADVTEVVQRVLRASERAGVDVAVVTDPLNRSFFVSVILPREMYDEDLRRDLRRLLVDKYRANYVEHRSSFVDDEVALIHFFCTSERDVDLEVLSELERDVHDRATRWEDRFEECLLERHDEREAYRRAADYAAAFPAEYRTTTSAIDACEDVDRLERLRAGASEIELLGSEGVNGSDASRLKLYLRERPYLTDLLPILHNCGLRVLDATLTEIPSLGARSLWIVTCRMAGEAGCPPRAIEALHAVLSGIVPDGPLNRLVLGAELDWAEVDLLRAYLDWAQQLGIAPEIRFAAATLLRYPAATRALLALFRARFDPDVPGDREAGIEGALESLRREREPILTADEDRVFARYEDLMRATVRTNFFARGEGHEHFIVLKLHPQELRDAPSPRPHAEIFVHSARMAGAHLRGGPIARGGIRWSDRVQDFRTEILGLVKTQMVKNGLIVPVGAKGGFVLKRRFDDREQPRAEADRQYAVFMRGLLSVTDNLADGQVVSPPRTVCHDGEDPYLVVAADKGTTHLSDVANRVAVECGYWLGDAFASGGSAGYDHKLAGITARGAWVCVRRQFMELGTDIEKEEFTVAGIGDMSGDVFGNGMLLARRARLLAAFNHMHVFLDPSPDPERAWQERMRLFRMRRSGWTDYDASSLSAGGGVFDRNAKAIRISPEVRRSLSVESEVLSGEELVRAILCMPVDLLWNGGVGTYVKASSETDADVGDRANDRVRVDASEVRARVVAEGGNLGFTQLARVEFALGGGRVHTDAVDNSGGVALSDREVNFKVLLAPRCARGEMSLEERNRLLGDCAEHANGAVLATSSAQSRCISLDELRGRQNAARVSVATEFLVRHAGLDLALEFLPDRDAVRARVQAGQGYTRPELAILLGYTKLLVKRELVASEVPDQESFEPVLAGYFPEVLRERFGEAIGQHPLRREITATCLCNRVIDDGGVTLVPELCSALGASIADVVAACYTMDRLLAADHMRFLIETRPAPETARLAAALRLEDSVRAAARSQLGLEPSACLAPEEFSQWTALVRTLRETVEGDLSGRELTAAERRADALSAQGLDPGLALSIERLPSVVRALGAVSLAVRCDAQVPAVVELHNRIGEQTRIGWVLERISDLDRTDSWDRVAAESLHLELLEVQRALTARLIGSRSSADAVERFLQERTVELRSIEDTVRRIEGEAVPGLAPLAVLARQIRRLC